MNNYFALICWQNIELGIKSSNDDVNKDEISTVKTITNENSEVKKNNEVVKTEKKQKKKNIGKCN